MMELTLIFCSTAVANKNSIPITSGAIQKVSTISAKDERSYGRHFDMNFVALFSKQKKGIQKPK
jgi:hypothetical protein